MKSLVGAFAAVVVAAAGGLAGCGSISNNSGSSGSSSCSRSAIQAGLYQKGVLTVATDKPAYPPWFENNNPVKCNL